MASFNVMEFLRPRKQAKAGAINGLAEQLHRGAAIDPEEIIRSLAESGATEQQLQDEIDRLDRVAKLRQQMNDGVPAQKRLDAIDAEISKAADKLQAAALEVQRLRDKHYQEAEGLRVKVRAAEDARAMVVEPQNLMPSDLERLRALQRAHLEAGNAHSAASKDLQHAKSRMRECEIEHPKAQELAKQLRNTPKVQEEAANWERAKAARTQQLADAESAMRAAEAALQQAERVADAFRDQLIKGGTR